MRPPSQPSSYHKANAALPQRSSSKSPIPLYHGSTHQSAASTRSNPPPTTSPCPQSRPSQKKASSAGNPLRSSSAPKNTSPSSKTPSALSASRTQTMASPSPSTSPPKPFPWSPTKTSRYGTTNAPRDSGSALPPPKKILVPTYPQDRKSSRDIHMCDPSGAQRQITSSQNRAAPLAQYLMHMFLAQCVLSVPNYQDHLPIKQGSSSHPKTPLPAKHAPDVAPLYLGILAPRPLHRRLLLRQQGQSSSSLRNSTFDATATHGMRVEGASPLMRRVVRMARVRLVR